jgi:hypothetical protein
MRSELVVVPRLNDANKLIQDYVIVPKSDSAKPYLTLQMPLWLATGRFASRAWTN